MNEVTIVFRNAGGETFTVRMDVAFTGTFADNGNDLINKAVEAIKRAVCITSL